MWHEALEEASRLYFGEHNIEGMLKVLEPLHETLEEGAMRNNTTIKETTFIEVVSVLVVTLNFRNIYFLHPEKKKRFLHGYRILHHTILNNFPKRVGIFPHLEY